MHKLTEEEKEADKARAAAPQGKGNEYSVGNVLKTINAPVNHPYMTPRPGILGSTVRPVPARNEPLPQQPAGTTDHSQPAPTSFDLNRDSVQSGAASNVVPHTQSAHSGPSQLSTNPNTVNLDNEENNNVDEYMADVQEPPGPNVNIDYGGHEVADFGDSELGPDTPPRLTPTGHRIDGTGVYSPIIPMGNLSENGNRAPTAPMVPLAPIAPMIPTPTNGRGMPPRPQGAATPQSLTKGQPRPAPPAPRTPVAPRPATTSRTAGPPATKMINNHGGPRLPHVESPKKGSLLRPRPKTVGPSTLREVKNASTLSSPSIPSSPPNPARPVSPTPYDSDNLDFNSSDLELDSDPGGPAEDYSEYPPDDSYVNLNEDFAQFDDNSRLDAADLESDHGGDHYSPTDEPSYGDENVYDSDDDSDGDDDPNQMEDDIDDSLPFGADEVTMNMGNPSGHYFYPANSRTEFSDDEGADQEILTGEDWGDEDVQNIGGPRTPGRTALRDGTTLDAVVADEDLDDETYQAGLTGIEDDSIFNDAGIDVGGLTGIDDDSMFNDPAAEVGRDGIDDDPMFNDEEELERARNSRLKAKKDRES